MKFSKRTEKYLEIKAERDLLKRRLSTAVDKELLLLMQNIELQDQVTELKAKLESLSQ